MHAATVGVDDGAVLLHMLTERGELNRAGLGRGGGERSFKMCGIEKMRSSCVEPL
jgi:hypothetical protein